MLMNGWLVLALVLPGWWGQTCCCRVQASQNRSTDDSTAELSPCCLARQIAAREARERESTGDSEIRGRCECDFAGPTVAVTTSNRTQELRGGVYSPVTGLIDRVSAPSSFRITVGVRLASSDGVNPTLPLSQLCRWLT